MEFDNNEQINGDNHNKVTIINQEQIVDRKCGDILSSNDYKIYFKCLICNELINNHRKFLNHIDLNHTIDQFNQKELNTNNLDIELDGNDGFEDENHKFSIKNLHTKYGTVLITNKLNFQYYCDLCQESFLEFTQFMKHTNCNDYLIAVEDEENTNQIKTEIKEEFSEEDDENCTFQDILETARKFLSINLNPKINNVTETEELTNNFIKNEKIYNKNVRSEKVKSINREEMTCNYCNKEYSCLSVLREHVRIHKGDRILLCEICNRGFLRVGYLDEHKKLFHSPDSTLEIPENNKTKDVKNIECIICKKVLAKPSILYEHLNIHYGVKPFKCKYCNLQFIRKRILSAHETQIHELELLKFSMCNKTFNNTNNVIEHEKPIQFNIVKSDMICRYCNQQFDTKQKLSYHQRLHELGEKYKCDICDKRFTNFYTLELHENTHKDLVKNYQCTKCPRSYLTELTRSLHESSHLYENFKKRCKYCGLKFEIQLDLEEHIKIHNTTNNKNIIENNHDLIKFERNDCEENFINNENILESYKNVNDDISLIGLLLKCNLCNIKFENQKELELHNNEKHVFKNYKPIIIKNYIEKDKEENLVCSICNIELKTRKSFAYHKRLHEVGDKFKCHICGKLTANKYVLSIHIKSHQMKNEFLIKPESKENLNNDIHNNIENQHLKYNIKQEEEIIKIKDNLLNDLNDVNIPEELLNGTTEQVPQFEPCDLDDLEEMLSCHIVKKPDIEINQKQRRKSIIQAHIISSPLVPNITNTNNIIPNNNIVTQPPITIKSNSIPILQTTDDTSKIKFLQTSPLIIKTAPSTIPFILSQAQRNPINNSNSNNNSIDNLINLHCQYCDRVFTKINALDNHTRMHTNQRPYKCNYCRADFCLEQSKNYHEKRHEAGKIAIKPKNINDLKKYNCNYCDNSFFTLTALERHIESHKKKLNTNNLDDLFKISCTICPKKFQQQGTRRYNKHMISHGLVKTYNCKLCNKEFLTDDNLTRHMRYNNHCNKPNDQQNQQQQQIFKCNYCPSIFSLLLTKNLHERIKHNKGGGKLIKSSSSQQQNLYRNKINNMRITKKSTTYKCQQCNKIFTSLLILKTHLRIHLPTSNDKLFSCTTDKCPLVFRNKNELKLHQRTHIDPLKPFKCNICFKDFNKLAILKMHQNRHNTKFKCNICQVIFKERTLLQEHKKIHKDSDKPFQCKICKQYFITERHFQKHIKIKHNIDEELNNDKIISIINNKNDNELNINTIDYIPVPVVPISNNNSSSSNLIIDDELLQENLNISNSDEHEQQFKCDECFKYFISEIKLRIHKKLHAINPFKCNLCTMHFKSEDRLINHKSLHIAEMEGRAFTCNLCRRVFKTKLKLTCHVNTHSNARPFSCPNCPLTFKTKGHYNEHSRMHTGDKPFKCTFCDMEFARSNYRLQHERKYHNRK